MKRFEYHPHKGFVLNMLIYVLKNNMFKFENDVFLQTCGIDNGHKTCPSSHHHLHWRLRGTFMQDREKKPSVWVRYIGNAFMIWPHAREVG